MNEQVENESLFEFYVAGVQFHELKTCIGEIELDMFLEMTPEPTNKYDPNAVKIEFYSYEQGKEVMIGYVPAKISASVSALMEVQILNCKVTELNPNERPWKQIKVAIVEA